MSAETCNSIRFSRPGGLAITDRALLLCGFSPRSTIADIGCGAGESVRHMRDRHGLRAFGVDCDDGVSAGESSCLQNGEFIPADAHALPFQDEELDGVFYECSISKMDEPSAVLAEAFRVLKPGGRICINDFFALNRESRFSGVLGRVEKLETWLHRIANAGFDILHTEDFSDTLREMWGQMVFDYGLGRILAEPGFDANIIRGGKHGYFLAVGKKMEPRTRL